MKMGTLILNSILFRAVANERSGDPLISMLDRKGETPFWSDAGSIPVI